MPSKIKKAPLNTETISIAVDSLKPHPLSVEIYGDEPDRAFVDNVRARGIIEPLLVTPKNQILAGNRRWQAAKMAGLKEVSIRRIEIANEAEQVRLILDSNRQREKTEEQRLREFEHYRDLEEKSASLRRGQRTDLRKNSSTSPAGRARDLAASKVGLSGAHAEKGMKVLNEIERRTGTNEEPLAEKIREVLNKQGIHAAYVEAREAAWIAKARAHPNNGYSSANAASHPRAGNSNCASGSIISPPPEEEDSPPSPSVVKSDLLKQIAREVIRDLERLLDGTQLRQFLADVSSFKAGWLKNLEGVSHE